MHGTTEIVTELKKLCLVRLVTTGLLLIFIRLIDVRHLLSFVFSLDHGYPATYTEGTYLTARRITTHVFLFLKYGHKYVFVTMTMFTNQPLGFRIGSTHDREVTELFIRCRVK
jgi:hypothetical protein